VAVTRSPSGGERADHDPAQPPSEMPPRRTGDNGRTAPSVRWARLTALFIGLVALVVVVTIAHGLPVGHALVVGVKWARRAGGAGYAALAAVYFGAVVLGLPTSLLTTAAGFLYGTLLASEIVIGPSLAGAIAAFALARSMARPRIERRLRQHPRVAAIDTALGERPIVIMTLLRLSPILPSNLLNYVFALAKVRFWPYLAACVAAMIPGTLLFAYAGAAITNVGRLRSGDTGGGPSILFWVGLAATALGTFVITRLARRSLARRVSPRPQG
jgi:uncharacterized membrane protein YdjX (TVP38/TMEM64 family)